MQRLGQKLRKTPSDPYFREQFFVLKRKYRSTCREEKRKFEQNTLQKLEILQFSNNGSFWNLLLKHYKELLQKKYKPTIKQPNECKNF